MSRHTGPITDEYLRALRHRNEMRMRHARLQLGDRWLLHPANAVRANPWSDVFKAMAAIFAPLGLERRP